MITYDWQFLNCKVIQSYNGYDNIIKSVDWKLMAIDGPLCAAVEGTTVFTDPSDNFIEFNNVTKEKMIDWVMSSISAEDMSNIEQSLAMQLMEMKKPILVQMPLPFN